MRRFSTPRWPRFVVDALHRNVSLLALVFLAAAHPHGGARHASRSISLGRGVRAVRRLLPALLAGARRGRVRPAARGDPHQPAARARRARACGAPRTGSSTPAGRSRCCTRSAPAATSERRGCSRSRSPAWRLCSPPCSCARSARWVRGARTRARLRARGRAAFALGLLLWLPSGPLGSEWARRSGTPASLLGHSSASRSSSSSKHRGEPVSTAAVEAGRGCPVSSYGSLASAPLCPRPPRGRARPACRGCSPASPPAGRSRCDAHLALHGSAPAVGAWHAPSPRPARGSRADRAGRARRPARVVAGRGFPPPPSCAPSPGRRAPRSAGAPDRGRQRCRGRARASAKDRTLLRSLPHLVLDGALLAAAAVGAQEIMLGVCESGPAALDAVARSRSPSAVSRRGRGWVGSNSSWSRVPAATSPARSRRSSIISRWRPRAADLHPPAAVRTGRARAPHAGLQRRDPRPPRADRAARRRSGFASSAPPRSPARRWSRSPGPWPRPGSTRSSTAPRSRAARRRRRPHRAAARGAARRLLGDLGRRPR